MLDRLLHDTTLAIAAGGFAAEMLNNFRWAPVPAPRLQPMVAALLSTASVRPHPWLHVNLAMELLFDRQDLAATAYHAERAPPADDLLNPRASR